MWHNVAIHVMDLFRKFLLNNIYLISAVFVVANCTLKKIQLNLMATVIITVVRMDLNINDEILMEILLVIINVIRNLYLNKMQKNFV